MKIREENSGDLEAIHSIHCGSFPSGAEASIVRTLRDMGQLVLSLVAEEGSQLLGHVAFSPVTLDEGAQGLGLAPVAVVTAARKQGVAEALIRQGLEQAQSSGWSFVVVLGDPSYYSRFGFEAASRWGLVDTYGGGVAFQALELTPDAIPTAGGVVRYSPAFETFD